jgi:hypothetical protein
MEGDGYTLVYHCPTIDVSDLCIEPDANPVYCKTDMQSNSSDVTLQNTVTTNKLFENNC